MAAELASSDPEEAHEGQPVAHPLLDRRLDDGSSTVFQSTLAPRDHWILDGHRNTHGEAILPGTGYLELARAAFAELTGRDAMELAEVYFVAPLEIRSGTKRSLRIRLDPEGENTPFTIESRPLENAANVQRWDVHAQGIVRALDATSSENGDTPETVLDLSAIKNRCSKAVYTPSREDRSQQEKHLHFGPRWRGLNEVRYGHGEAIAEVELPAVFSGDLHHYKLHPAMLDIATGFGLPLLDGYAQRDDFYVPLSYEALQLYQLLPCQVFSHLRCTNPAEPDAPSFDVTLMDDHGRVAVELRGFTMKRVSAEVLAAPSHERIAERSSHSLGLSGSATDGLTFNLAAGLLPREGIAAFDRVLAAQRDPQIVISTVDLSLWLNRIDQSSSSADEYALNEEEKKESHSVDTPVSTGKQGNSDYVGPRDDLEKTIQRIWKKLLGRDKLSVTESLFDLGGNSLLLTRAAMQIRSQINKNVPIQALFDCPTVAGIAETIRGQTNAKNGNLPEITRANRDAHRMSRSDLKRHQ